MRSRLVGFVVPVVLMVAVAPLHASAAAVPPYQLTVSLSSPTMTYGGASPQFRASMVPPAGDSSGNTYPVFYFTVNGKNVGGNVTSAPGGAIGLFLGSLPMVLDGGQYPVVANYVSPNYGLLTSAPVTLTVEPATPSLGCGPASSTFTYAPGTSFPMTATGVSGGSMTVTFSGPQTYTTPGASLDASGGFVVTTPQRIGQYTYKCDYSGSTDYTAGTVSYPNIITVSANHAVAGINLFTDPAPLQSYTLTTWEVVVAGQLGLPAPTGTVSISIGNSFIRPLIQLGPGGVATFDLTSPAADPWAGISIGYQGDTVYQASSVHLPITTAPIPHATGTSGPPVHASTGVTGADARSNVDATASPSTSPSPLQSVAQMIKAPRVTATSLVAGNAGARYVAVGLIGMIVVVAVIAAMVLWRRRRAALVRRPTSHGDMR